MKPQIAHYLTLKYRPVVNRSEHVNYGIVVFLGTSTQVHLASSLRKIRAIDPGADLSDIRDRATQIPEMVANQSPAQAVTTLRAIRWLEDETERDFGAFAYHDQREFDAQVDLALRSLCNTVATQKATREPKSRLFIDVRQHFKMLGIMASTKNGGELPDHQVLEHYAPDPDVEVTLEFALQNGALRAAQTIDLRPNAADVLSATSKNVALSKAFSLNYAKDALPGLIPYLVVAGSESGPARKMLNTLTQTSDRIFIWESGEDRDAFFSDWAEAAGKPLPTVPLAY